MNIYVSELAYGRFTSTFLFLIMFVFLLLRSRNSKTTLYLALYFLFFTIYNAGYFLSYLVYSPFGSIGWYMAALSVFAGMILIQFAYNFPQHIFKKESKIIFIISLILSTFTVGEYIYNAVRSPIISTEHSFGSIYGSKIIGPIILVFYLWTIIVLFRQSLKAANERERKSARIFALIVIFEFINTISIVIFINFEGISFSQINFTMNIGFMIIAFLYAVVYINNSKKPISFIYRLVGISLVTILVVLSSVGYYTILNAKNSYDDKCRAVISLISPNFLKSDASTVPDNIKYIFEVNKDGSSKELLYSQNKNLNLNKLRYWEEPPTISQLINKEFPGNKIHNKNGKLKNNRFYLKLDKNNYYVYLKNFNETIYAYAFDCLDYRKAVHPTGVDLIIAVIITTILIIALLPFLFYSGLIKPLNRLLTGVHQMTSELKFVSNSSHIFNDIREKIFAVQKVLDETIEFNDSLTEKNKDIRRNTKKLGEISQNVYNYSDEQKGVIEELTKAIDSINDLTQTTLTNAEKVYSDAKTVGTAAIKLEKNVEAFNKSDLNSRQSNK